MAQRVGLSNLTGLSESRQRLPGLPLIHHRFTRVDGDPQQVEHERHKSSEQVVDRVVRHQFLPRPSRASCLRPVSGRARQVLITRSRGCPAVSGVSNPGCGRCRRSGRPCPNDPRSAPRYVPIHTMSVEAGLSPRRPRVSHWCRSESKRGTGPGHRDRPVSLAGTRAAGGGGRPGRPRRRTAQWRDTPSGRSLAPRPGKDQPCRGRSHRRGRARTPWPR